MILVRQTTILAINFLLKWALARTSTLLLGALKSVHRLLSTSQTMEAWIIALNTSMTNVGLMELFLLTTLLSLITLRTKVYYVTNLPSKCLSRLYQESPLQCTMLTKNQESQSQILLLQLTLQIQKISSSLTLLLLLLFLRQFRTSQ